jgi:acetate CoA/acetoacetate CoA-transferase alpha subunit
MARSPSLSIMVPVVGKAGSVMRKMITLEGAVELIPDGASLMIGGFLGIGSPHRLIGELVRQGRRKLTVIANDSGRPGFGIGKLIDAKAVARLITSHIGTNPVTQQQVIAGDLKLELVPQGTLAERIRSAGFGLGGVLTPTGLGTSVEDGKRTIEIDGKTWLLDLPIAADFALIAAQRADYRCNLDYAMTARNFNPIMAMAGGTVIAEAATIVPVGVIPPDEVVTPGVLVKHLVRREAPHAC